MGEEKSVFSVGVTLGVSTTTRQASHTGVVDQNIMDSTVFVLF